MSDWQKIAVDCNPPEIGHRHTDQPMAEVAGDRHDPLLEAHRAAAILRAGGLVVFPTETVYGLGADASNPRAVARIYAAKRRPVDHPLIVHLLGTSQLTEWARHIPRAAWQLAEAFWPGPLTLVLPREPRVPGIVSGWLDTVALRVPDHQLALALLDAFGSGVAAPSANRYGHVSPTSAEDVREELGDNVDFLLDGGNCPIGIESTIVDLSSTIPRILRPGAIPEQALQQALGTAVPIARMVDDAPYPGQKLSHYAPQARVILSSWDDALLHVGQWHAIGQRVGLLAQYRPNWLPENVTWLYFGETLQEQARVLYNRLRQADHLGVQVLVTVMPAEAGIGYAICDRLRRAAGQGGDGHARTQRVP
ncbi:L-threonylcarbamoyladenylate synthase [Acidihalobacter aeolianus]|uniref:L-threonylcarbamoyladenylate synthase n=1 Tax=Acidihalobacter aeolianus TaxID=2792603 RepID=UPI000B26D3F3|nr:L-threonylcarbamoyladenylate synthase [Acidihalobacter aeolianus]